MELRGREDFFMGDKVAAIRNHMSGTMLHFFLLSVLEPGNCYSVAPRKSGYPAGVAQFLGFLESIMVIPSSGFPWITLMQSWIKPPGVW